MTKPRRTLVIGLSMAVVLLALAPIVVCQTALRRTVHYYDSEALRGEVFLREFPFPFRSALSICNDVDSTTSLSEFLTIQEFLNTRNQTPLGEGIGLEISNSFFAKSKDFGLFSPYSADQEVILDLIRGEYIDAIHSFDLARTREDIKHVAEFLAEAGASVPAWVNHSTAPSNLGPCTVCIGDDDGSQAHHTDFSLNRLGYRFVWLDAVSGIVGQGRPVSLGTFFDGFDRHHPLPSLFHNVAKEQIKFTLAALGSSRYSMRKNNELVRVVSLDDGQPVFEFTRSNQCFYGLWECASADGMAETLREDVQKALINNGGYMIVYTHLGINGGFPYLAQPTVQALRSLAERNRAGDIWVTTTSRLLRYYVNKKYLEWEVRREGDTTSILIHSIEDPVRGMIVPDADALGGVTFYVNETDRTRVLLNGRDVADVVANPPDETGRKSITIPLRPLENLDARMSVYKAKGYF